MTEFKIGDHIRKTEVEKVGFNLTYGKTYVVIGLNNDFKNQRVGILNDEGRLSFYFSYRFELDIQAMRENVINEILN